MSSARRHSDFVSFARLPVALLCAALTSAAVALADDDALPRIEQLSLGFQQRWKLGHWTPVQVTLHGGREAVRGTLWLIVPDGDGLPTRVPAGEVQLAANGTATVAAYAKIGRPQPDIEVIVDLDGRTLQRRFAGIEIAPALDALQELVVEWGTGLDLVQASRIVERPASERIEVVAIDDLAGLPTEWFGYDGVDVVAMSGSSALRLQSAEPRALDALEAWVRSGGRLLLSASTDAEELFSGGGPLARFAPGQFADVVPLRGPAALESFAGGERLDLGPAALRRRPLLAARLTSVIGRIEAFDGSQPADLPLVVRRAYGFGQVVFVAVDLSRPPLDRWAGRSKVFANLLGWSAARGLDAAAGDRGGQVSHLGYVDLSGQLRSALDQFADVRVVPFGLVMLLAMTYIAALFPLEYLLVTRWLSRPGWMWATFPALILAFGAGAVVLAYQWKGTALRVNQAEVVDVDTSRGDVRGTTWVNVFSPEDAAYDIAMTATRNQGPSPQWLVSWMGLPGTGLGGMSSQVAPASSGQAPYTFASRLDALSGVPIPIWSSKGFQSRWEGTDSLGFAGKLQGDGDRLLGGSITNDSPLALASTVLLYGRSAYQIGALRPGQRLTIDRSLVPHSIDTLLTRRRMFGDKEQITPYDRAGTDAARILEMMMFYRAAGGSSYTGLSNRYQSFLDLSEHLQLGNAILVARGPAATSLVLDDTSSAEAAPSVTYYRFLFPVER